MAGFGLVTIRPMFGGAGVYHDGLMFALLDDEVLYLKADDTTKAAFVAENLSQFTYMSKGGKLMEMAYWRIPERAPRRRRSKSRPWVAVSSLPFPSPSAGFKARRMS